MAQILTNVVAVALTALVFYAWINYVKPYIEEHHLVEAAEVAVHAAEAIYGRYGGEEKLQNALNQLADAGWDINAAEVYNAVQAAWERLNTSQIGAGIKKYTETSEQEQT